MLSIGFYGVLISATFLYFLWVCLSRISEEKFASKHRKNEYSVVDFFTDGKTTHFTVASDEGTIFEFYIEGVLKYFDFIEDSETGINVLRRI